MLKHQRLSLNSKHVCLDSAPPTSTVVDSGVPTKKLRKLQHTIHRKTYGSGWGGGRHWRWGGRGGGDVAPLPALRTQQQTRGQTEDGACRRRRCQSRDRPRGRHSARKGRRRRVVVIAKGRCKPEYLLIFRLKIVFFT